MTLARHGLGWSTRPITPVDSDVPFPACRASFRFHVAVLLQISDSHTDSMDQHNETSSGSVPGTRTSQGCSGFTSAALDVSAPAT